MCWKRRRWRGCCPNVKYPFATSVVGCRGGCCRQTDDTKAIGAAFTAASKAGGGSVVFPTAGSIYMSYPFSIAGSNTNVQARAGLWPHGEQRRPTTPPPPVTERALGGNVCRGLRMNVGLCVCVWCVWCVCVCVPTSRHVPLGCQVDSGVTVRAIGNPKSWPSNQDFVTAKGVNNIVLTGGGVIDGNGFAWPGGAPRANVSWGGVTGVGHVGTLLRSLCPFLLSLGAQL